MLSADQLVTALSTTIDSKLSFQLIEEAIAIEEAFIMRRWKYTELDGGRFAEVAARITYAIDSGHISHTKSVDDCLKYVENSQVPHHFPEPQAAIHLAKVIRSIYKLRSQRGAVHVSATYTANELDSKLIVEAARWLLAELLRIFVSSSRDEVADTIRHLARFPQPLMRVYGDWPLLQSISFTTEEEVLAHLLFADDGLTIAELIQVVPKDQSSTRRAVKKMSGSQSRQVTLRSDRWLITDLGIKRIEEKLAQEASRL